MIHRQNINLLCYAGTIPYKIKKGDTLNDIAKKFHTTVPWILLSNPNILAEKLVVDQVICIPKGRPKIPYCPTLNYYVIAENDTFYKIANKFNVSLRELIHMNPTSNPYKLYNGEIICIPLAPSPVAIVINTKDRVLVLYRNRKIQKIYPIAVGKPETPSPQGTFVVKTKQVNPGGPFGTRWIGLSVPHYGIHGTADETSIGNPASNGCIRLYNEDANELFNETPIGTVVVIR